VRDEDWPAFRERVSAADALLQKGQKADPGDLPTAVLRIETALLGTGDIQVVAARFEEAVAIDPTSEPAHRAMLRALDPRWLGADETMLAFARESVRRHATDPELGLVLLDAHARRAYEEDPSSPAVSRYFRTQIVWQECFGVLQRYLTAHPDDPWGHNRMAWLAWRGGHRGLAARELELLDGDYLDDAWDSDLTPEQARNWAATAAPPSPTSE
jgi:hypothetical protein